MGYSIRFGIDSYLRLLRKGLSGFGLRIYRAAFAHNTPINIRPQRFAHHNATGFALDVDAGLGTDALTCRHGFSEVAHSGAAAIGKARSVHWIKPIEEFEECFHLAILPFSNAIAIAFSVLLVGNWSTECGAA